MNSSCVVEDFVIWYNKPYENDLSENLLLVLYSIQRKDNELWAVMQETREDFFAGDVAITNGQIMEVSGILCRKSLSMLKLSLAGTHGPITDQDIFDIMCSPHCILNDHLRTLALNISRCNCVELSPSQGDLSFKKEGAFCFENSGDYLCSALGNCGVWQCALSDYGCRRKEYNQREIPLRSNECNTGITHCHFNAFQIMGITAIIILLLFHS